MIPNREESYCCGGGAGLVAIEEKRGQRIRAGLPKAEQIRGTGAAVVVASCDNCQIQIRDLNEAYGLGVKVSSIAELVVKALKPTRVATCV
jgi:Fe-S oxidoreductase